MTDSTTESTDLPTRCLIRNLLQGKILEAVETVIDAELTALLETARYERSPERRGYRNGKVVRQVTTEHGPMDVSVPRGRVQDESGGGR